MNTPAHVMLSAVALGHGPWQRLWAPITAGALAPDAPMLLFYLHQRLVRGASETVIWREAYFDPAWQTFFDVPNSVPLIGIAMVVAWRAGAVAWLAGLASMALHAATDLLVHREDAHGHFFPLTDWRFVSPVSYWNPEHHGSTFALAELALVVGAALWLLRPASTRPWRGVAVVTLVAYAVFGAFAWIVWMRGGLDA